MTSRTERMSIFNHNWKLQLSRKDFTILKEGCPNLLCHKSDIEMEPEIEELVAELTWDLFELNDEETKGLETLEQSYSGCSVLKIFDQGRTICSFLNSRLKKYRPFLSQPWSTFTKTYYLTKQMWFEETQKIDDYLRQI